MWSYEYEKEKKNDMDFRREEMAKMCNSQGCVIVTDAKEGQRNEK